jgi:CRISPR-associated protein Cas2
MSATAMYVVLVYDISNDRARLKVSEKCLDYGLDRFQLSAFFGKLNRHQQTSLMFQIEDILEECGGNVKLIPVGEREWEARLEVGDAGR